MLVNVVGVGADARTPRAAQQPRPRLRGGRALGRAIQHYEEAYGVDPTNAEYIGNLAKASLMHGTPLEEVRYLLRELRLHETRPVGSGPVFFEEGPLFQPTELEPEVLPTPAGRPKSEAGAAEEMAAPETLGPVLSSRCRYRTGYRIGGRPFEKL